MKIVVLGAGAMGGLYGGLLSQKNDVTLIDLNQSLVDEVQKNGLTIVDSPNQETVYHPAIATAYLQDTPADLVIVFVKSLYSRDALETNKAAIGKDTYLMTLQNGSGHESLLEEFTDPSHIIIGTTQHNASMMDLGVCRHGGSGTTYLGCIQGDVSRLQSIADVFTACGLEAKVSDGVQKMIWNKMFTNVSASVLTGILQVPLGFISSDLFAWQMCQQLIREAVDVANKMGMDFNYEQKVAEVKSVCDNGPQGLTSLYADLKAKRRTEVDTISGSVLQAGEQYGVPTPTHKFAIQMIHAMEDRDQQ